jgi:hypothetical protein
MRDEIEINTPETDGGEVVPVRVAGAVALELTITDAETCAELEARAAGRARHDFAAHALKIGVLAIRQAQGRIDADAVRNEGDRLIAELGQLLRDHHDGVNRTVASNLKDYFDPESGRFNERVERLIKNDGELEQLLRRQVGLTDSELARTLASHLGESSPILSVLDPEASDGILAALATEIEKTLKDQRELILGEFSLDNKEGALSRLVAELAERHGEVGEALEKRIDEVVSEFSLDHEDSALSRLVRRVETTQKQISSEFSLDEEGSALARLRRELLDLFEGERKARSDFHREVLEKLADMTARREEAARSTRHGNVFEDAVFQIIQDRSQKAGDVAVPTGSTTGLIKNCKVGDVVVEIGPEHSAGGSRIAAEAKEKAGYTLADALAEIEVARKNRGAGVGLFVFSVQTAPEGLEAFARYGNDVVIVWDADDPRSDVVMVAGLSVARALCARARAQRNAEAADFEAIDRAILEIEKQAGGLEEITRSANTIKSGSEKILKRAGIMRTALDHQIELLGEKVQDLKVQLGEESEA